MGTFVVVRSALNSHGASGNCTDLFMCEGGAQLRGYGFPGRILVDLGGELLGERKHTWLKKGLYNGDCGAAFDACDELPEHYQYPLVDTEGRNDDNESTVFEIVFDVFKKHLSTLAIG